MNGRSPEVHPLFLSDLPSLPSVHMPAQYRNVRFITDSWLIGIFWFIIRLFRVCSKFQSYIAWTLPRVSIGKSRHGLCLGPNCYYYPHFGEVYMVLYSFHSSLFLNTVTFFIRLLATPLRTFLLTFCKSECLKTLIILKSRHKFHLHTYCHEQFRISVRLCLSLRLWHNPEPVQSSPLHQRPTAQNQARVSRTRKTELRLGCHTYSYYREMFETHVESFPNSELTVETFFFSGVHSRCRHAHSSRSLDSTVSLWVRFAFFLVYVFVLFCL